MRNGLAGPGSGLFRQHGMESAFAEFKRLDRPFNVKSGSNPYGVLLFRLDYKGYQAVHSKKPNVRGQVADVWPPPLKGALEQKLGFIERIPGTDICIGNGIYR